MHRKEIYVYITRQDQNKYFFVINNLSPVWNKCRSHIKTRYKAMKKYQPYIVYDDLDSLLPYVDTISDDPRRENYKIKSMYAVFYVHTSFTEKAFDSILRGRHLQIFNFVFIRFIQQTINCCYTCSLVLIALSFTLNNWSMETIIQSIETPASLTIYFIWMVWKVMAVYMYGISPKYNRYRNVVRVRQCKTFNN